VSIKSKLESIFTNSTSTFMNAFKDEIAFQSVKTVRCISKAQMQMHVTVRYDN
jgi:hypothetical protein